VFVVGPQWETTYAAEFLGRRRLGARKLPGPCRRGVAQAAAAGGDRRRRWLQRRAGAALSLATRGTSSTLRRALERLQRPAHGGEPDGRADARYAQKGGIATSRARAEGACSLGRTRSIRAVRRSIKVYIGHHGDSGAHAAD
jgi:NADH-quinone oxidoreductase subunit G